MNIPSSSAPCSCFKTRSILCSVFVWEGRWRPKHTNHWLYYITGSDHRTCIQVPPTVNKYLYGGGRYEVYGQELTVPWCMDRSSPSRGVRTGAHRPVVYGQELTDLWCTDRSSQTCGVRTGAHRPVCGVKTGAYFPEI